MPEKITAENLLNRFVDTIAEKQKSVSFFQEEKSSSVSSQLNRLFGRQKPVHHLLGGGKCMIFNSVSRITIMVALTSFFILKFSFNVIAADCLLWRNKKISTSVISGSTAVWVLFEWLNYHLLTLVCLALALMMLAQFLWTNGSGLFNRSQSKVPRLVIPEDIFLNIATTVSSQVNQVLGLLQDVACGGNLKQFLIVAASLWAVAIIGSWCNFLTVIYIGFVAAHTLPVLYEKHEDQVDNFVYMIFDQLKNHYQKLDAGVLSKIPRGKYKGKKYE